MAALEGRSRKKNKKKKAASRYATWGQLHNIKEMVIKLSEVNDKVALGAMSWFACI